ncbi:MAG TPA: erythronate-4-phosphate dehydrogenase, partial [Alcanivorax sp.]|nr:erythronate-4-phosphate dehydrogenase [Alcanivorax sp.]
MHIVADENMPALDDFERLGRVTRVDGRSLTRADLRDADILLVRSVTPVTEALLADTPVRFVGSATIGTDHVDLDALDRLGIAFACAPGCNARAVAEYVLQALLMASQHHGRPLRGSTVGVIGLGNVGGLVAAWLRALDVKVLGC